MMIRKMSVLLLATVGVLTVGCPVTSPTDTNTNFPPGDPVVTLQPFLSVSSSASFLQFNALGLSQPQFSRAADLQAVLSNAEATQIAWRIEVDAGDAPILRFVDVNGTLTLTSSGANATVTAVAAPADQVRHGVTATATLMDGTTLEATIEIVVTKDPLVGGESNILTATPTADPVVGTNTAGEVLLSAGFSGEVGDPLVEWSPVDPSGIPAGLTLPANLSQSEITLTVADGVTGIFPFRAVVSDSVGQVATGIVNVFLGVVDLTLDVSVTRIQLNPVSQIVLRTIRAGGVPDLDTANETNFSYTWQVIDENNLDVTGLATFAPPSGTVADGNLLTWVITGLPAGAYRIVGTVTDRLGHTNTQSASILLSEFLGVTVSPSVTQAGPGGAFNLRSFRTGGQPPFSYTFTAVDAGGSDDTGQTAFVPGSGTSSSLITNDWMVSGFATADTYRFFVTVTDGAGNTATGSTAVAVGDVLTLDAKADELFVDFSGNTTLTFDVNGGVGPYTYTFANFTNATGVPLFSVASPANSGGNLSLTWTAPAMAAGVVGAYRTDVTVSDSVGNTAVDSVMIQVGGSGGGSGASFTVDVQARFAEVGTNATYMPLLQTRRVGGVTPLMSFAWSVYNEAGANVAGNANNQIDVQLAAGFAVDDDAINWNATFGSMVPVGTYRFEANVQDADGSTAVGSTEILANDPVHVSLSARTTLTAPGVPVEITATPTGGSGTYSYAFTNAVDSEGDTAGSIAADPADGATGATVWASPTDGNGTYTVSVTVTDTTLNTTATASLGITVTDAIDLRRGEIIIDPPAAQTDLSGVLGVFENGPNPNNGLEFIADLGGAMNDTIDFAPENSDPGLAYARSLTVLIIDADTAGLAVSSVDFIGTNQRGEAIMASAAPMPPFNAGSTFGVNVPFRTLDRVRISYTGAAAGDMIEIGIGEFFGLAAPFPTANEAQADRAFHVAAIGTNLDTNPESATFVDPEDGGNAVFETAFATPDQQGVRFPGNLPDGSNDYIVQFEPMSDISVDLEIDAFLLSAGGGGTANVTADVHGGVPPYNYALGSLGVLGVPNAGTVTPSGAMFMNVGGDLPDSGTGQVFVTAGGGPAGIEVHYLRVQVTDSAGNVAVATVPVLVMP
jgi:hypothetical protein